MTSLDHQGYRQIALKALARRRGSPAKEGATAAAAQRAYDDLARVSAPLIGQVGIDALTGRTLYLVQRNYQWLALTRDPGQWTGPFTQIIFSLRQQTPAAGLEAAGVIFATLAELIATLIGEALTMQLLQEAWPDAFIDAGTKEK